MYRLMRRHSADQRETVIEEVFSREEAERLLEVDVSYLQKNCQVLSIHQFPYLDEHDCGTLLKFDGFWIRYWIEPKDGPRMTLAQKVRQYANS